MGERKREREGEIKGGKKGREKEGERRVNERNHGAFEG